MARLGRYRVFRGSFTTRDSWEWVLDAWVMTGGRFVRVRSGPAAAAAGTATAAAPDDWDDEGGCCRDDDDDSDDSNSDEDDDAILTFSCLCHANAAHSRHRVLPVPVGDSKRRWTSYGRKGEVYLDPVRIDGRGGRARLPALDVALAGVDAVVAADAVAVAAAAVAATVVRRRRRRGVDGIEGSLSVRRVEHFPMTWLLTYALPWGRGMGQPKYQPILTANFFFWRIFFYR
jgi:hypothetical protein